MNTKVLKFEGSLDEIKLKASNYLMTHFQGKLLKEMQEALKDALKNIKKDIYLTLGLTRVDGILYRYGFSTHELELENRYFLRGRHAVSKIKMNY